MVTNVLEMKYWAFKVSFCPAGRTAEGRFFYHKYLQQEYGHSLKECNKFHELCRNNDKDPFSFVWLLLGFPNLMISFKYSCFV